MAKRFWTWFSGMFRKLGKTEYDMEEWRRLEFRSPKKTRPLIGSVHER